MKFPNLSLSRPLSRRTFLKGAGAALALPHLESMAATSDTPAEKPRRMIAMCNDLGFVPDYFFPEGEGTNYRDSPYTEVLKDYRDQFTIFSGLSHPECVGGHLTDQCFLTGARHPRKPGFKNTISIDQVAAAEMGAVTRFPSLSLRIGPGSRSLSYGANGVRVPAEESPSRLYRKLFVQGSPDEVERQVTRLRDGQSLMDAFSDRVRTLEKKVGTQDKERLEQYFTAFREMEHRLNDSAEWEINPKPKIEAKMPKDERKADALIARTRLMHDLAKLAIETDSTRIITIITTQQFNPKVDLPGVELAHHALTHQQSLEESREQLAIIEKAQLMEFARLLGDLRQSIEGEQNLLDRTMVLLGSNLGNANNHSNKNLPAILAGGGFKHGKHLNCDQKGETPLANLYLSMLQRLGSNPDRFSTSTGALKGLEFAG
jgi:hypothetical protein